MPGSSCGKWCSTGSRPSLQGLRAESAYMGRTLGQLGGETESLDLAGHFSICKSSGGLSGRLSAGRLRVAVEVFKDMDNRGYQFSKACHPNMKYHVYNIVFQPKVTEPAAVNVSVIDSRYWWKGCQWKCGSSELCLSVSSAFPIQKYASLSLSRHLKVLLPFTA